MSSAPNADVKKSQLTKIVDAATLWLQNPQRLRIVVLSLIVLLGLGGLGYPMSQKISVLDLQIQDEILRAGLIKQYQYLNTRLKIYHRRLPKQGDLNWWTKNILDRTRATHFDVVSLRPLSADAKRSHSGNGQGMFLILETVGSYRNILQFISDIENAQDSVHISKITLDRPIAKMPLAAAVTLDVFTQHGPEKKSGPEKAKPNRKIKSPDREQKKDGPDRKTKSLPAPPGSKTPDSSKPSKEPASPGRQTKDGSGKSTPDAAAEEAEDAP